MGKFQILSSLVMLTSVLLSACGAAAPAPEAMMEKPAEVMMEKEASTPDTMMKDTADSDAMMPKETAASDAMMETPSWYSVSLTDARTGETFNIHDMNGKVVLVETMAQWCSNCKKQQGEVKALRERLGMEADLVTIGLDIDPNENAADLKNYVESNGFDWLYAVAPAEVSREIAALYGDHFLNPPSTPILIIDREGVAHPLPFGIKNADDLFEAVNMYLKEGM